jgi:hypothetical protein
VDEKVLEALHKISFHNVGTSKDLFKNILNHNLMTDDQSQYFINSVEFVTIVPIEVDMILKVIRQILQLK